MPADPLDQLRLPVAPLAPRAPFAEDLRRRLVAELAPLLADHPEEDTMAIDTSVAAPTITLAMPCDDARRMIDWMVELFGFVVGELHEAWVRPTGPGGQPVGHRHPPTAGRTRVNAHS